MDRLVSRATGIGMVSDTADSLKCVYVLYGHDEHLRQSHRQDIVGRVVGGADRQLALSEFDADADLAAVLDELRTLPFLTERRLVTIRDADAFVSAHRKALEKYLERPTNTSVLLLEVSSWPSNTNLAKKVALIGEAIACQPLESRQVPAWLAEAVRNRGKRLDPQAAGMLAEWIGPNRASLEAEIEKLSLYVGPREVITADDVGQLVTASAGPEGFALSNALTNLDAKAALKALGGMLSARGDEFRALGLIAYHVRRVLRCQQLASAGKDPAAALPPRLPPTVRRQYQKLLASRPLGSIQRDLRSLTAADLAMKSGKPPTSALQELVVGLCS